MSALKTMKTASRTLKGLREESGWETKEKEVNAALPRKREKEVAGGSGSGVHGVFPFREVWFWIGSEQDCGRMGAQVPRRRVASTEKKINQY